MFVTSATTVEQRLQAAGGRPSGFDYLRLGLALAVVATHFVVIDYGSDFARQFWLPWKKPVVAIILPMFFALSGFLVAASLFRSRTLITFIGLRVIRIVPALTVEVLLSAVILGSIFTTKPLSDYFSDSLFYRYFLNILGFVQFGLPGVFATNPFPDVVNAQLWTIPWELYCYVTIALMSLCYVLNDRRLSALVIFAFFGAVFVKYGLGASDGWISVHGIVLVESFLAGILFYIFRDTTPMSLPLLVVAIISTITLLLIPNGEYLVAVPAAYITVYCGTANPRRNSVLLGGDYSYGIYLYGFPIQQAVAHLHGDARSWHLDALVVFPLTVLLAAFSWRYVEKPTLALRKYLPELEARILTLFRRVSRAPSTTREQPADQAPPVRAQIPPSLHRRP